MANEQGMAEVRLPLFRAAVSSTISNWKEKILKRYGVQEYIWWRDFRKPVVFFGLYRPKDYLKLFWHRGERTIVWCGSDIFYAGWLFKLIQKIKARHICENHLQQAILRMALRGIEPEIRYNFYGDPNKYPVSFKPSKTPHVWLCSHSHYGAEKQSGLNIIEDIAKKLPEFTFHIYGFWPTIYQKMRNKNVIFHGNVSEEQMDEEIKNYQAGLRLHQFDGFSEIIAKSILCGQYPISTINYPFIDCAKSEAELIILLKALKGKQYPNHKAREFYLKEMERTL